MKSLNRKRPNIHRPILTRNYPRRISSEPSQVPNTNHILVIVSPPLYTTQRKPWQCGAATMKGDKTNPYHVNGTHVYAYKCAAM